MRLFTNQFVAVDEFNRIVFSDLNGYYEYSDNWNTYSFIKKYAKIDVDYYIVDINKSGEIIDYKNKLISRKREDFKDLLRAIMGKTRWIDVSECVSKGMVIQNSITEYSKMFYYEYDDDQNRVRFVLIHGDMGVKEGKKYYMISSGEMIYNDTLEIVSNGSQMVAASALCTSSKEFEERRFTDKYIANKCKIGYSDNDNVCWIVDPESKRITTLTELE